MAVKSMSSSLDLSSAMPYLRIQIARTVNGFIIDTSDYEAGLVFFFGIFDRLGGEFVYKIYEGDKSDMSDAVLIPPEKFTSSNIDFSGEISPGESLYKVGIFSNKRYVRLDVISSGTGIDGYIFASVVQGIEYLT